MRIKSNCYTVKKTINLVVIHMMNDNQNPWDSPDTFGKQTYNMAPGQAHLAQWPLKLSKVSSVSPYFHMAHLLIAADCAAYSYAFFHQSLLRGRLLAICCSDMEENALTLKIEDVIKLNDILSIRVVRMDAPCCGNFAEMVVKAVTKSKKDIPIQITTVFAEGEDVEECYGGEQKW